MINVTQAKEYLHIDHNDDDGFIAEAIKAADEYLQSSVDKSYDLSYRSNMLLLMVISDLYENRGATGQINSKTRDIVNHLAFQIRLEIRSGHMISNKPFGGDDNDK